MLTRPGSGVAIALRRAGVRGSSSIGLAKEIQNYEQYLSERSLAREPSIIRSLQPLLARPGMISLGGGMPNSSTFPFKRFTAELSDGTVLELGDVGKLTEALQYSPTKGLPRLTAHLERLQACEHAPPRDVKLCITTGSQDALSKAFEMLIAPGDNLLVEAPTYSGSLAFLRALGAQLIGVPTDGGCLQPDALRALLKDWQPQRGPRPKVLYTIPTGSNPTGGSLTAKQKADVYEVAREYDLLILEDDAYYFMQFLDPGERRVSSFLSMDTDGRVLRFDSFSKLLSSGIRIGFATGPAALIERMELHTQVTTLHTPGLTQAFVASLFDDWAAKNDDSSYHGFIKHVDFVADFYRKRRDSFLASAEQHLKGLATWNVPRAGMFVWMKLTGITDTWSLIMDEAVDKKVILVPGQPFSIPSTDPSPYVRASYSTASLEDMDEALRRFSTLLRERQRKSE